MKCDELKAFRALDIDNGIDDSRTGLAYHKAPVDEVIAELETERDAFEKSFNEMTEAFMRSQRAFWLAKAEIAKDRAITCDDFAYLGDTERNISMTLARTWMKCRLLIPSEWSKVWKKIERKCLKKAEEYK